MTEQRWTLPRAFDCTEPALVAIVGGGGKSSLMFALAADLPEPVVLSTTTRIFAAQMQQAAHTLFYSPKIPSDEFLSQLQTAVAKHGRCLVVGAVAGEKAIGVPATLPVAIWRQPFVRTVIVEADGSRMRPIKAPAAHEPVVPSGSSHVVPVVGVDALEMPLAMTAHRPELVAALLGIETPFAGHEYHLTPEDVAVLLSHPQGGAKNLPAGAKFIPFLNKVHTPIMRQLADQIAGYLLQERRVRRVVIGAMQPVPIIHAVWRRVTAVVLAAGRSQRMGGTKQLLPWGETTVLGQTLRTLRETSVTEILVVSGHDAARVEAAAAAEDVQTVYNPDYIAGEMLSSLQTAVRALSADVEAVLVVLADQPMVPVGAIELLLTVYREEEVALVAPTFTGQRGNPVLIDRRFFPELLELQPGEAPRHLLRRHHAALVTVPVTSAAVLRDLDSPEAYRAELKEWLGKR